MRQTDICSIGTNLDARAPSLKWLQTIVTHVDYYLSVDSKRAGAAMLKEARSNALVALKALEQANAESAAFFALGALQAAWTAEMIEGRQMIDAGVTAYRRAESENARRHAIAEQERDGWRNEAKQIQLTNPRMSKSDIARKIDPERWNTIRKYI